MGNQEFQPLLDEEETFSDSFEFFKSQISNFVILFPESESETLCFSWIQRCLKLVPKINNAFTNLVYDLDYPMGKWRNDSIDEYMNYSLYILDYLNLISFSISQLDHSRLSLSHDLTLQPIKRLKPIKPAKIGIKEYPKQTGVNRKIPSAKQEAIIQNAIKCLENVGFRLCGVVLSVLSGNPKPDLEIKKLAFGFSDSFSNDSCLSVLDAIMERKMGLKEMKDVNLAVDCHEISIEMGKQSDEDRGELQRKLEEFERKMNGLGREVDGVFYKVLQGRNQMIDTIRI